VQYFKFFLPNTLPDTNIFDNSPRNYQLLISILLPLNGAYISSGFSPAISHMSGGLKKQINTAG
jgi:hypothetical protein